MRTEKGLSLKFYILIITLIFSCAGFSQDSESVDPLEDLNRKFFTFNFEVVDPLMLEPLARSYEKLTPNFTKKLVHNFLVIWMIFQVPQIICFKAKYRDQSILRSDF